MNKKEVIVENEIMEESFTVDNTGRVSIVDDKKLLEMVSGGVNEMQIDMEVKSSLLSLFPDDELSLIETLTNNCNCGSGSGSGTGSSGGSGGTYVC